MMSQFQDELDKLLEKLVVEEGVSKTNADVIRSMSDEDLAWFLAKETTRIAKPVFDYCGMAVNEEVIFLSRLLWLQEPAEECE